MSRLVHVVFVVMFVTLDVCSAGADTASTALVAAARARTRQPELYDGSYRVIAYPMGDVPSDRGVCTDLDLVTWMLPGNLPHIGIVRYQISNQGGDRSKPPPPGASPGGFTVRRLSGPVTVDGRLWIAVDPVVGVRTVRAPNGQFTVSLDGPNEEGDVTRFRLSFAEGGRPVALVSDVVSYAFITGDSRWIVFEPVDVIDVRAWRRYTLSKLFDIGPYVVVKAISPDGRRLLISRRDCPFDCPNDRTEYYEIGFPAV